MGLILRMSLVSHISEESSIEVLISITDNLNLVQSSSSLNEDNDVPSFVLFRANQSQLPYTEPDSLSDWEEDSDVSGGVPLSASEAPYR